MFSFRRPTDRAIGEFLRAQAALPLTYEPVGMTSGPAPDRFVIDRNSTPLGAGEAVFRAACDAIRRWEMFRVGWVTLIAPEHCGATLRVATGTQDANSQGGLHPPAMSLAAAEPAGANRRFGESRHNGPRAGSVVGILVRCLGLWSLNACRVIQLIDEEITHGTQRTTRFGLVYGTLPGHAECGEERFAIEWNRADDSVRYEVLAYSRPQHFLTRWGKPVTRRIQRQFARASLAAMRDAVSRAQPGTAAPRGPAAIR